MIQMFLTYQHGSRCAGVQISDVQMLSRQQYSFANFIILQHNMI